MSRPCFRSRSIHLTTRSPPAIRVNPGRRAPEDFDGQLGGVHPRQLAAVLLGVVSACDRDRSQGGPRVGALRPVKGWGNPRGGHVSTPGIAQRHGNDALAVGPIGVSAGRDHRHHGSDLPAYADGQRKSWGARVLCRVLGPSLGGVHPGQRVLLLGSKSTLWWMWPQSYSYMASPPAGDAESTEVPGLLNEVLPPTPSKCRVRSSWSGLRNWRMNPRSRVRFRPTSGRAPAASSPAEERVCPDRTPVRSGCRGGAEPTARPQSRYPRPR